MKKSWILIIVAAVILGGLALGAFFFYGSNDTQGTKPVYDPVVGFTFPSSADEINWKDREIFRANLVSSAAGVLDELPQATTYYISIEIPDDLVSNIKGHQIVQYFNNEDETLGEIYFRLFPNYQGGYLEVSHLTLNGGAMIPSLESNDTSLRIDLNQPLKPGESLVLEMDFELIVPTEMGGNYGLLGYFEDVLVLDTFYPMIPAFDETGWYKAYPQDNGDHTYNDASFYIVEVKAPADLVMASSGVIVDTSVANGSQTTVFAAGPARDFYLGGSRVFVEMTDQVGETKIRILTRPEFSINQELAVDYAVNAIEIMSEQIGEYPYTEFEVMSSPMRALGIEYPGITSLLVNEFDDSQEMYGSSSAEMLESTLVHEAGHMWFYNAVGNDQQNQPWVDESLTQYVTYLYYLNRYGSGSGYVDSWEFRWSRVEYADVPIGMPAEDYHGAEYGGIVYGRGPLFFLELEKKYGLDTVMEAIQNYYADHLWDIGYTADLRTALEDACGCDLSSEFNEWVYK